jgi:hypothetical protein
MDKDGRKARGKNHGAKTTAYPEDICSPGVRIFKRCPASSCAPKPVNGNESVDRDAGDTDVIDDIWPYWSLDEVGTYHASSAHDADHWYIDGTVRRNREN